MTWATLESYNYIHLKLRVYRFDSLDRLYEYGLYINELSMHDCSRDLLLVNTERTKNLKTLIGDVSMIDTKRVGMVNSLVKIGRIVIDLESHY